MAAQGFNNHGTTNGTTNVTMLAAPPTGMKRKILLVTVTNVDSASTRFVNIVLNDATTLRILHRENDLAVDTSFTFPAVGVLYLQDATESLEIDLENAATTTEYDWTVHYEEFEA